MENVDSKVYFTLRETINILSISKSTAMRGLKAQKLQPWISALRVSSRRILIPAQAVYNLKKYEPKQKVVSNE